eukprot:1780933-Pyramimonas_sp.AAC.1
MRRRFDKKLEKVRRRNIGMNINCRSSARMSWISAGPPGRRLQRRPRLIHEICAEIRKVRGDAGKDPKERRGELAGMQSQFDKIDGEGKMTEEVKAQYNFGMSVLSPSMSLGGQVEYLQGLGETGWSMLET